ncbi:hypothetical protein D3C81_2038730 [compost metagenome]
MQRPWVAQVLHPQQHVGGCKHRVGQLDQAHPLSVQGRPADSRQPAEQGFGETLFQAQGHAAHGQQHGKARQHVLEQVGALLPDREQAEHRRQQQAT